MTIGELYSSHLTIPFLDLDVLLEFVLRKPKEFLYGHPEYVLTKAQYTKLLQLIRRRKAKEPIAYLVGEKEFFGLPFKVTTDVLIPRPDTEHAVVTVLQQVKAGDVVCDVGTGAGAIAVAVKHTNPAITMLATDISKRAVAVAKRNAKLNHSPITFFVGDVLAALPKRYYGKLNCIVFNAPYLTKAEARKANLKFEPQVALTPKGTSTSLYAKLIQQAPHYLAPHGKLVFEIGYTQAKAVSKLIKATFPQATITITKDYGGYDRVVLAQL